MKVFNIGFKNSLSQPDETQLDADSTLELINLILSLQKEMDIKEILYIEEA